MPKRKKKESAYSKLAKIIFSCNKQLILHMQPVLSVFRTQYPAQCLPQGSGRMELHHIFGRWNDIFQRHMDIYGYMVWYMDHSEKHIHTHEQALQLPSDFHIYSSVIWLKKYKKNPHKYNWSQSNHPNPPAFFFFLQMTAVLMKAFKLSREGKKS